MDIAGDDLSIPTSLPPTLSSKLVEAMLKTTWIKGVIERESDREFFYYTSKEAQDSWNDVGWSEQNAAEMIHVISEPSLITIVHERDDLDVEKLHHICSGKRISKLGTNITHDK